MKWRKSLMLVCRNGEAERRRECESYCVFGGCLEGWHGICGFGLRLPLSAHQSDASCILIILQPGYATPSLSHLKLKMITLQLSRLLSAMLYNYHTRATLAPLRLAKASRIYSDKRLTIPQYRTTPMIHWWEFSRIRVCDPHEAFRISTRHRFDFCRPCRPSLH